MNITTLSDLIRSGRIESLLPYHEGSKKWYVSLFFPLTFLLFKYVIRFLNRCLFMDNSA
jgi:hypothetical protein